MNTPRIRFYNARDVDTLPQMRGLAPDLVFAIKVVAAVLPFRVNNYVVDELIDWSAAPDDPMFQLTFPRREMLPSDMFERLATLMRMGASESALRLESNALRATLQPHPDAQFENVPVMDGQDVDGVQHKYFETCLVFPSNGQTCHAFCTYCFRWPQFVGDDIPRFTTDESRRFEAYIRSHREITDVVLTGGDPLTMSAQRLASYIEPFLAPEFDHVRTVRIGTKALAFWPYRFLTDPDSDAILRLFERVTKRNKHLAFMTHFSHWKEQATPAARDAIQRIRATGATIRTQAPVMAHVNDSGDVWARMWADQVQQGCVPYYMFVARHTGPHRYFAVPLERAFAIFSNAYRALSGLCATVRGPVMSTAPGKITIDGIEELGDQKMFILRFLRARNPAWCLRPFLAKFDADATWLSDLRPVGGSDRFFFEEAVSAQLTAEGV